MGKMSRIIGDGQDSRIIGEKQDSRIMGEKEQAGIRKSSGSRDSDFASLQNCTRVEYTEDHLCRIVHRGSSLKQGAEQNTTQM